MCLGAGEYLALPPDVTPWLLAASFPLQGAPEADAVDWAICRDSNSADLTDGGQDVGKVDQRVTHGTGLNFAGITHNEWDTGAIVIHLALAETDFFSVQRCGNWSVSSVVAGEDDDGIFPQLEFLEFGDDLADYFVHVVDHIGKMFRVTLVSLRPLGFGVPVLAVWGWGERAVGQQHRVIGEEGLGFVLLYKVADEVGTNVWPVFSIVIIFWFAIDLNPWIAEAAVVLFSVTCALARVLPEAGLVEAKMLRGVLLISELPFACDAGGVACSLERVGKGFLFSVQQAKLDVVADVEHTGHDLHAARSADRVRKTVGKSHPAGRELIQHRSLVIVTAVGSYAFVT